MNINGGMWMRDVASSLPDVLKPQWLNETWSGAYGTGGLEAEVSGITSIVELGRGKLNGRATVDGIVLDDRARQVGEFTRGVELGDDAQLTVQHEYLELDAATRGTGFARAFNDHAFARYAEAGVDKVGIHAALSVGGYAWARQGFELASEGVDELARTLDRGVQLKQIVLDARNRGRISSEQYLELKPRMVGRHETSLRPDALTSIQELAAHPLGRDVLLGSNWYGARPIEHAGHNWWNTASGASVSDAGAGARMVQSPVTASQSIGVTLPGVLDPNRAAPQIERSLRSIDAHVSPDSRTTLMFDERGAPIRAEANYDVRLGSGRHIQLGAEADLRSGAVMPFEDLDGGGKELDRGLENFWSTWGISR